LEEEGSHLTEEEGWWINRKPAELGLRPI
jgi:hypothetical protein